MHDTVRLRFVSFSVLLATASMVVAEGTATIPAMPMPIEFENTIKHRWLSKPVLKSRLLDDMESPSNWSHNGFGEMIFAQDRAKDGKQSIRLTSPTVADKPGATKGRPFGSATLRREFDGENWSGYNRLSFWVYPTLPGFRIISLCLVLHNEGSEKVPGPYGRNGRNHVLLEPDRWNHVVWEIAHLGRDKVTGVDFIYRLQGNEPGATKTVCYDIDHLELQEVDADHFEGWDVTPGEIAYCHTGYPADASKTAIASNVAAKEFTVVDTENRKAVLTKPIGTESFRLGRFQIMDFSEIDRPGTYSIKAGDAETRPFQIRPDIWRQTIWKTINFFYCERCGTEVAGIHDTCHRDWLCKHGDHQILINGGWHDAGDLSQGLVNTAEATYAMLSLARRLQHSDSALAQRLLGEARWGLDWILKTRFDDGYRCTWATMDFWTDGIIGTVDDVTLEARNRPFENFLAASAEALGGQMLKEIDPIRSAYFLQAAERDWRFALEKSQTPNLELAAAGLQSSIDLYEATKQQSYADQAFRFADIVLECQQQTIPLWDIPLTGFFYRSPKRERILHYSHRGHEQAPIVGLSRLCHKFANHPDWMEWYAAVVLYCEYFKTIVNYTAPYYMLPASIYRIDESGRGTFREQVKNGIRLSGEHYLRLFPVWYDFRGNHGTVLSQAKGLAVAAHLRKDADLIDLCQKQLQWVLGRNPFCQSTMYGEGHDYAPQYTAMSGDMVGSLPVGIQTHFDRDVPYWPADNCYNYKEVWVHPSSRWLWLMCDLFKANLSQHEDFALTQQVSQAGDVSIQVTIRKPEEMRFALRTWNLESPQEQIQAEVRSQSARTITWRTKMIDKAKPWIAVVIPNDDLSRGKEVFGALPQD